LEPQGNKTKESEGEVNYTASTKKLPGISE